MPKILLEDQLAGYERDGYLSAINVFSASKAQSFREALEEQEKQMGGCLRRMDNCHLFFCWAHELSTDPAILDVMEDLLGSDLFVHSTRIFYKHPHDPSYVSWHQDGTYSKLNSKPAPSAWIALSESTRENGCLRVIPRSHWAGKLPHLETHAATNLLNHGEEVQISIDESTAQDVELEPGQMSLHHVNLIHGSNPNTSDKPRIGFAVSYITPEVRRSHLPVIRARGSSQDHEFELVPGPQTTGIAEAVQAHSEFVRKHGLQRPRVGAPA